MNDEKIKVIIDTDPGIDDAACLIYALFDERLDVKLVTSVPGNVKIDTGTRNLLHLLDKFNLDIPVAKGPETAMYRVSEHAEFIHQIEGLGGYIPPEKVERQLLDMDAAEAMYKVLNEGNGDIIPLLLGPHTNMGTMLKRHPDIIKKIPLIIFEGGSPYGVEGFPNHISFNISSDPEAFKIILDSKIPLVMVPSYMGRNRAYLTEDYVYSKVKDVNKVGDFLFEMYDKYWEPGYSDKRIATNDTCAYIYLTNPEYFDTRNIDLDVDLEDKPGKTIITFKEDGKHKFAYDVDREKVLDFLYKRLKNFDGFKLN